MGYDNCFGLHPIILREVVKLVKEMNSSRIL